jgi:hypothetical protein
VLPLVASTIVPPGRSVPVALGRLDHRQPDAVLHGAARAHELALGVDGRAHAVRDGGQAHQRRPADQLQDALVGLAVALRQGGRSSHGAGQRPLRAPSGPASGWALRACRAGTLGEVDGHLGPHRMRLPSLRAGVKRRSRAPTTAAESNDGTLTTPAPRRCRRRRRRSRARGAASPPPCPGPTCGADTRWEPHRRGEWAARSPPPHRTPGAAERITSGPHGQRSRLACASTVVPGSRHASQLVQDAGAPRWGEVVGIESRSDASGDAPPGTWRVDLGGASERGRCARTCPGPSPPPLCVPSSSARSSRARSTIAAGKPASRATWIPYERSAPPRRADAGRRSRRRPRGRRRSCSSRRSAGRRAGSARGSAWRRWSSRRRARGCARSRPTRSRRRRRWTCRGRSRPGGRGSLRVAPCTMAAVSLISTMKVDCPRARLSEAPTRVKIRSTTGSRASSPARTSRSARAAG